ncbi:alpha/beta hydrolase [Nocardia cyriacigeorgica]|nr:alpha/beta hydrolase [Nocardia cyriacigeorgica]
MAAQPLIELPARRRPRRRLPHSPPAHSGHGRGLPVTATPATGWIRGGHVDSADGTTISWLARGHGPVIVAVHGGLGSAVSMMPLAAHLDRDFEVVAMNCRGHGTSAPPQSPADIAHEIADIIAVIDAVGPIAMLFGYSYGAVVALETALAAPAKVPKLVLYEPPLPITYPLPDLTALDTALAAGDYEQLLLAASTTGGGFSADELAALREDPLWPIKVAQAPTLAATMRVLAGLPRSVDRYAAISTPTRLITGTTSADYLLAAADLLAEQIPVLSRDTLTGQGHHPDPQQLARAVAAFGTA